MGVGVAVKMSLRTVLLLLASALLGLAVLWVHRSGVGCSYGARLRGPGQPRLVLVQDDIVPSEPIHPVEPCLEDELLITPRNLVSLVDLLLWLGTFASYANDLANARKLKRRERRRRRRSSRNRAGHGTMAFGDRSPASRSASTSAAELQDAVNDRQDR